MRRAARIDQNHQAIVEALRASGWRVWSTARQGGGYPDLTAYKPATGVLRLIEVKAGKGKLRHSQSEFHNLFPVSVLRSVSDALALR